MKMITTAIPDVLIFEPKVYRDNRGFFLESYNQHVFEQLTGLSLSFVQDNHSRSSRFILRGIHYQIRQAQGKLVRVVNGEVFDVAVDLRRSSPSFGKWVGVQLSDKNLRMLWIPKGFGHAFCVLSESADFLYKTTDYYAPDYERCIIWNDPDLAIDWPINAVPSLSQKDLQGVKFRDAEVYD
jgi:dTDP-4-dehydrorhamnose 3,5-epimerase